MRSALTTENPLGNTGENTTTGPYNSTFYSPFSPSYMPGVGMNDEDNLRSNPPREPDLNQHTALAIAGLLVNKKWAECRKLCEKQIEFIANKGSKVARQGSETFGQVLTKVADYCASLEMGDTVPTRRAIWSDAKAVRDRGTFSKGSYTSTERVVSIWDDVAKSALAAEGNAKLPFAAYSEMPVVTCPGAGAVAGGVITKDQLGAAKADTQKKVDTAAGCAAWCYSYKAFGKPTKLSRLYMLTLGSAINPRFHARVVADQMLKLYNKKTRSGKKTRILRLFVDGDFRDQRTLQAWMEACDYLYQASGGDTNWDRGKFKGIVVYGYSKSWDQFLSLHRKGYQWPKNYILNISSGSKHGPQKREQMRRIPVSRGTFNAVPVLERLVLRALGAKAGMRAWNAFEKQTASMNKGHKAYTQALSKLLDKVRKADRDLYDAWVTYETRQQALKKQPAVLKKLNALSGQKMTTGFAQQQARAALLRVLDANIKPVHFACPIDCGTCPMGPLGGKSKAEDLLEESMNIDEVADEARAAAAAKKAQKALVKVRDNAMHACGNAKMKADINIGLH